MDSSFFRPVERSELHVGSTLLPLTAVLETVMNEPTLIEHADIAEKKKAAPHWLSPNYIDLHMRSARLMSCEATSALHRHFAQLREQKARGQDESVAMAVSAPMESCEGLMRDEWNMMMMLADNRSFLEESFC
ncbi:hypothetical protein GOP47_0007246 [Adiantum capillus-veneris]|uniref:Uncharacterized protein n=1 Tax=Adiantum capillus-veneris TaxID=13818 RepID=A0A9D4ZKQ8_ADICA|nr:hypothetical protein GOP47_0007246 [Adiantum capillus-veneris]